MKTLAGINTAVTGVGTVAGGVALGTGIAKTNVDQEIAELEKQIQELERNRGNVPIEPLVIENKIEFNKQLEEFINTYNPELLAQKEADLIIAEQKSKTLGNIRTGTMAGAAATNIAGTVIAAKNRVRGDLESQIAECIQATKILSNVRMQARVDNSATDGELKQSQNIISKCGEWEYVELSQIDKRARGATLSSAIGATTGITGTITSASANSETTRNGDAQKEKNLNTASNVLAGTTTAASAVATVFNATQISAIKKAATVADECEEALR